MRFPGFTDEWRDTQLGENATIKSGISPRCLCNDGNVPYYKVEQLNHCEKELEETPYYGQTRSTNIIPKGSIIFPKRGAAIMTNKVRINSEECILDTNLMALIPESTLYNHFLFYYILQRELGKIADTSTIPQINNVHINPLKIAIPAQFEEQRRIGDFLSLLDERITTQNKIIDDLQSLIKGLIQYLVHDGIKNGSWQNIMLSEILTQRNELNTKYHPVHSVSVSAGVINQVEYLGRSFSAKDTAHYHVVNHGDIVYTKSPTGNQPYGIIKQSHCMNPAAVSPLYGVYEPVSFEVGNILHYYFLNPLNTNNYLLPLIQKGAKNTINISNQRFLENSIPFPTNNAEICCVSKMLSSIDSKIKLENKTLDTFIKQKRYLLNMLFI